MLPFWVCLCAALNCLGWVLSAGHQLHRTGYLISFGLILIFFAWWRRHQTWSGLPRLRWRRRRWRRAFPLLFLGLASLAILGGLLHAPSNYDGLAYRIPRTLHWLAEEQWHWIHTDFPRLNNRATGFEWLSVPWLAFTQTDRFLFLINAGTYLLLPGLVFSILTRLGVRARVAVHWMWLLPTGYGYVLQAGSIGNDLVGCFYVLAAVHFALRAAQKKTTGTFGCRYWRRVC